MGSGFFSGGAVESMLSNKKPFQFKHAAFFDTLEERETKTSKQFEINLNAHARKKNFGFLFQKRSFHVGRWVRIEL